MAQIIKLRLILFVLIFSTRLAFSQAGRLDSTFGAGGKINTIISGNDMANSMCIQLDGKILLGCSSFSGNDWDFSMIRFNADGSIDNTFGNAGKVIADFNSSNDESAGMALQHDGKIILVGESDSSASAGFVSRIGLMRYLGNGKLDSSFGNGGKVITVVGGNEAARSVAVQPDEKIIIAGYSNVAGIVLIRYNSNGTLDNSFGTKGIVKTAIPGSDPGEAFSLSIRPDGKILVAGYSDTSSFAGRYNSVLLRYINNGRLDSSFGSGGIVITNAGIGSEAHALIVQPDKKILVAGSEISFGETLFSIAKYDTTGVLDASFGTAGIATASSIYPYNDAYSIALQSDGKILIAGDSYFNSGSDFALMRFFANGKVDSTFGDSGIVMTTFATPDNGAYSMALQTDGKIVLSGYSSGNIAVARYLADINLGIVQFALQNNSVVIYPNPIHDQTTLEYTLTKDESLGIELRDVTGRLIKTIATPQLKREGVYKEQINLEENIPAGNYFLILTNGSQRMSVKLLKQ